MNEALGNTDAGESFQVLLSRVRAGSQEAAWELFETYERYILRAVRRRLGRALRTKFDSQDFAQAVWFSFFKHRSQIADVDHPLKLVAYMAEMAVHKVIDEHRRQHTLRHDVRKERPLDRHDQVGELLAREPTPSQFVMVRERWERMLAGQTARNRRIIQMRYEGHTQVEIAQSIGVTERTVRRVLEAIDLD
jgi:RNA polymerase sigma factor (sigma-70 family)